MESRLGKLAVEALFPRFCAACKREGSLLCEVCTGQWSPMPPKPACPFCGKLGSERTCATCREQVYLDGLTFFSPYGNPVVRDLIAHWKYEGDRSAEAILQMCLCKAAPRLAPPILPFYATGVPLHEGRRRARGFDQGEVIAGWAGEMLGIPRETYLRRSRSTRAQARTSHASRRVGEMDEAFEIVGAVPSHVLLCDDVFTSGTTMDAAARALKEAGAKTVWGFVIAKG